MTRRKTTKNQKANQRQPSPFPIVIKNIWMGQKRKHRHMGKQSLKKIWRKTISCNQWEGECETSSKSKWEWGVRASKQKRKQNKIKSKKKK